MSAPTSLDGPHWRFALDLYGRPGVGKACLALQDGMGLDANVLLVALYAATRRGLMIGLDEIAALDRAVTPWRGGAIEPLRAMRRALKAGVEGPEPEDVRRVRSEVQRIEIESERIGQAVLAAVLSRFEASVQDDPGAAALEAALTFYGQGAPLGDDLNEASRTIRHALERGGEDDPAGEQ